VKLFFFFCFKEIISHWLNSLVDGRKKEVFFLKKKDIKKEKTQLKFK